MTNQMKNYIATDQHGYTVFVSACTENDARKQAEEKLGFGNLVSLREA